MARTHINMQYIELTIYTTHLGSELVADVLFNFTQQGVVINDIEDVIALSKSGKTWDYLEDGIINQDRTVLVKAYFPIDDKNAPYIGANNIPMDLFTRNVLYSVRGYNNRILKSNQQCKFKIKMLIV